MTSTTKYARETLWAFAAKGVAFVFYYALVFWLTRRMTVDAWGNWSGFLALLNIVLLVSDHGLSLAVKRYVSQARSAGREAGVIRSIFFLRVGVSLVFAAVIGLAARPALSAVGQPLYAGLMQRAVLLVAGYGLVEFFKSTFEALHNLRSTFLVNLLEHGSKFAFVVLLFRGGSDFSRIIDGLTTGTLIAAAGAMVLAWRMAPAAATDSTLFGITWQVYLYSVPAFLMSIGGVISLELDTIMLKALRGDFETGVYSAAKQVVMFLPHIALSMSMGTIPSLAVFEQADARRQRATYYRVLGLLGLIYLLVCAGLALSARPALALFFGERYHGALIPMWLLLPFVLCNAITIYTGSLMIYRGLAWQRSTNLAVTIFANIVLNWLFIPRWGAPGAAAASSLAYVPYALLNLRAAHRAFVLQT